MAVTKIMKSVDKLTIGLESRLFAGAMTGIGNYCFHLLRALMTDYPELSFVGFDWRSWKRLDAAALCEIENSSPSLEPDWGAIEERHPSDQKEGPHTTCSGAPCSSFLPVAVLTPGQSTVTRSVSCVQLSTGGRSRRHDIARGL